MNLLIIAALKSEVKNLLKFYRAEIVLKTKKILLLKKNINSDNIYFGITGTGRKNVKKFFKEYFKLKIKTDFLISTGYAGAVNPLLNVGDIVIAKKFICKGREISYTLPIDNRKLKIKFYLTTGVGVDTIVLKREKLRLKEEYKEVDFVDMESCEIIKICDENQINFIIFRVISDTYNFEFPDFEFIKDSWRRINYIKLFFYILKNPLNLFKILSLRWNLAKASKLLSNSLIKLLKTLLH